MTSAAATSAPGRDGPGPGQSAAPYSSGRAKPGPEQHAGRSLTAWNDPASAPDRRRCLTYRTVLRGNVSPTPPSDCAAVANAARREIADVIVLLAGGYSSYMTGEAVPVSGHHA